MVAKIKQKYLSINGGILSIGIVREFHAAHWLNNYKGKCSNIHGHAWKVECIITGEKLNKLGMIIDFGIVKKQVDKIISKLDHHIVNFIVSQPTAENISKYFYNELYRFLRYYATNVTGLRYYLSSVKIFETEDNFCVYTYDNWLKDKQEELAFKASQRMIAMHKDPIRHNNMVEKMKKSIYENGDEIKSRSDRMKINNPMNKKETVEKMLASLRKTLKVKPNKVEKVFIDICEKYKLDYKFVGDFSFFVNGKNPDFVCLKQKRLIEIFGRFWHSNNNKWYKTKNDEKERKRLFEDKGWKCLIIWDDELKNIFQLIQKIKNWERSTD